MVLTVHYITTIPLVKYKIVSIKCKLLKYKNIKCKISWFKDHQIEKIGDTIAIGKGESVTNSGAGKYSVIGSQDMVHFRE